MASSLCLRGLRHAALGRVHMWGALALPRLGLINHQLRPSFNRTTFLHTTAIHRAILKSKFKDFEIPNVPLTEYVFETFDKYGDRPALIDAVTGKSLSFLELREKVKQAASGLTRHGFKNGDTIMFLSVNSVEYVILFHAALSVGGVITTCNPAYPVDDVVRQAIDAKSTFIFASPEQIEKAKDVAKACGKIQKVFGDGEAADVRVEDLLNDDGSCHPGRVEFDARERVAILPYSSGTTGLPKGVMLTHYGQVANTVQGSHEDFWSEYGKGVQLGVLPFYHIFAIWGFLQFGLRLGYTLVVMPGFQPELFLETVQKYKVSMFFAVPPMVLFMTKNPLAEKYDLSSLKRMLVGAAPLGEEVEAEFKDKYPDVAIGQGYGMTETAPLISLVTLKDCGKIPGSIGNVVPNTEAKFVDPVTREEVAEGERGEMCVRGPQNMKGYLNRPDATAHTVDSDGWLHTGDIGYANENGHIYIVDRVKELIKYKGLQVPPAELEALLCTHPAVADAGVIGLPDEEAGELPKAYVQLKAGVTAKEQELIDFVAGKVVAYKKLRGGLEFIDILPRTASGKILRRELKDLVK